MMAVRRCAGTHPRRCRRRRVLLLGEGDLTEETCEALRAAGADVTRLEDPSAERAARGARGGRRRRRRRLARRRLAAARRAARAPPRRRRPDRRDDLRPGRGRELEQEIGNCTITSLADIVAPDAGGPVPRRRPRRGASTDARGCAAATASSSGSTLPEVRARRARALATRDRCKPFDRSAALVFFGAVGLVLILVFETIAAAIVLEQALGRLVLRRGQDARDRRPEPGGPGRAEVVQGRDLGAACSIALLFAAAFTGGLVERLIGRNLTGLVGRRAVPQSDHVIVVGLGQVGLRLCLLLRECGRRRGRDRRPARRRATSARRAGSGIPVVIGARRGPVAAAPALDRPGAARSPPSPSDDLQNIKVVALRPRGGPRPARSSCARAPTRRAGETRSLERLGHVRDVHRIGAVYLAGPRARLGRRARGRRRRHGASARRRTAASSAAPIRSRPDAPPAARRAEAHVRCSLDVGGRSEKQRIAPGRRKPDTPETRTPWGPQGMSLRVRKRLSREHRRCSENLGRSREKWAGSTSSRWWDDRCARTTLSAARPSHRAARRLPPQLGLEVFVVGVVEVHAGLRDDVDEDLDEVAVELRARRRDAARRWPPRSRWGVR